MERMSVFGMEGRGFNETQYEPETMSRKGKRKRSGAEKSRTSQRARSGHVKKEDTNLDDLRNTTLRRKTLRYLWARKEEPLFMDSGDLFLQLSQMEFDEIKMCEEVLKLRSQLPKIDRIVSHWSKYFSLCRSTLAWFPFPELESFSPVTCLVLLFRELSLDKQVPDPTNSMKVKELKTINQLSLFYAIYGLGSYLAGEPQEAQSSFAISCSYLNQLSHWISLNISDSSAPSKLLCLKFMSLSLFLFCLYTLFSNDMINGRRTCAQMYDILLKWHHSAGDICSEEERIPKEAFDALVLVCLQLAVKCGERSMISDIHSIFLSNFCDLFSCPNSPMGSPSPLMQSKNISMPVASLTTHSIHQNCLSSSSWSSSDDTEAEADARELNELPFSPSAPLPLSPNDIPSSHEWAVDKHYYYQNYCSSPSVNGISNCSEVPNPPNEEENGEDELTASPSIMSLIMNFDPTSIPCYPELLLNQNRGNAHVNTNEAIIPTNDSWLGDEFYALDAKKHNTSTQAIHFQSVSSASDMRMVHEAQRSRSSAEMSVYSPDPVPKQSCLPSSPPSHDYCVPPPPSYSSPIPSPSSSPTPSDNCGLYKHPQRHEMEITLAKLLSVAFLTKHQISEDASSPRNPPPPSDIDITMKMAGFFQMINKLELSTEKLDLDAQKQETLRIGRNSLRASLFHRAGRHREAVEEAQEVLKGVKWIIHNYSENYWLVDSVVTAADILISLGDALSAEMAGDLRHRLSQKGFICSSSH